MTTEQKAAGYAALARRAQEDRIIELTRTYTGDHVEYTTIKRLIAERDRLRAAVQGLLAEPYGCPRCDSGVLRKPIQGLKGHTDDCPYALARATLEQ